MIYYGKETKKALENFPISGLKAHEEYVLSVVLIKKAAALVNLSLGLLQPQKATSIVSICDEILSGKYRDQFVIDPYQAGAGTSCNMNINEVIANLSSTMSQTLIHPNDDVNMSQSTNDVIPTSIRLAVLTLLPKIVKQLKSLNVTFIKKSRQFSQIIKSGRTHLQDALPITLGQEFASYAKTIENDTKRIERTADNLFKIGIGGTAVGTGINTHPDYHKLMINKLSELTKLNLKSSGNLLESANNTADFLDLSGSLKVLAVSLIRIGNDLRLLSSGPKAGLAEIILPEVQAGSSIMPGKVNPSIIEMLTMVCFQVVGYDSAISMASSGGQMELNVFTPLIAYNLPSQIKLLTQSISVFNEKCLSGIIADEKNCESWFEKGSGLGALLNPYIGYEKSAKVVRISLKENKTIQSVLRERKILSNKEIDKIFATSGLTKPNLSKNR